MANYKVTVKLTENDLIEGEVIINVKSKGQAQMIKGSLKDNEVKAEMTKEVDLS